ncbi:MAG: hypothetical protein CL824_04295 [Crocinitomicaceae bacterium]|nr:hypothetical protein [Crocinitomicaceae bacterium]
MHIIFFVSLQTLIKRIEPYGNLEIFMVFLCLLIICIAKLIDSNCIKIIITSFFKLRKVRNKNYKGTDKINQISSFLMLTNYLLSSFICISLFIKNKYITDNHFLISFLLTGSCFIILILSPIIIGFLTKNKAYKKNGIGFTLRLFEFLGCFILLLCIVNLSKVTTINISLIMLLTIFVWSYLYRTVKLSLFLIKNEFHWYHLILYLCTLEFLPLTIGMVYFSRNFIG